MGSAQPPEHQGCNLQLQLRVPSWECLMLPHISQQGHSSMPPAWAVGALPTPPVGYSWLCPASPACPLPLPDHIQLLCSMAQQLPYRMRCCYSPLHRVALRKLFRKKGCESSEIRMLSDWGTISYYFHHQGKEIRQDLMLLRSLMVRLDDLTVGLHDLSGPFQL